MKFFLQFFSNSTQVFLILFRFSYFSFSHTSFHTFFPHVFPTRFSIRFSTHFSTSFTQVFISFQSCFRQFCKFFLLFFRFFSSRISQCSWFFPHLFLMLPNLSVFVNFPAVFHLFHFCFPKVLKLVSFHVQVFLVTQTFPGLFYFISTMQFSSNSTDYIFHLFSPAPQFRKFS